MKSALFKKTEFYLLVTGCLILLLLGYLYAAEEKPGKIVKSPAVYTSNDLPDPFQSPFDSRVSLKSREDSFSIQGLKVQGLVWDSQVPQAIINDEVVAKGQILKGAEILDIRQEGVYIFFEGKQYILRPQIP